MEETRSYILIGPPGSGKSTLASSLAQQFNLVHIDIGAELRAAASVDTPFAEEINNTINHKQELVSDMVVYGVLAQALMRVPDTQGVMLDGAPRPASQIDEVLHILRVSGRVVSRVIFINLPEAESIRRISRRFSCNECGQPLVLEQDIATSYSPCPHCGGKVGQRTDDTVAGVEKRYRIFQQVTLPVVEYFRKANLLLEVDGTQSVDELLQSVQRVLVEEKAS